MVCITDVKELISRQLIGFSKSSTTATWLALGYLELGLSLQTPY